MTKFNPTSICLFSAPERELVTLSMSEIIDGLVNDYKSLSHGVQAGVQIPEKLQESLISHSCILYAEGLRLAHTHLELAMKLIMASLFESNARAANWFAEEKKTDDSIKVILKKVEAQQKPGYEDDQRLYSIFGFHARAVKWLAANGGIEYLKKVFKEIEDFETFKAAERNKKES